MKKVQRLLYIESVIDCNRDPKLYELYPMLYLQVSNQPKEMQEKLYVWKARNLVECVEHEDEAHDEEVKSMAGNSPLAKVIKILFHDRYLDHSYFNNYYNQFFKGTFFHPNGLISIQFVRFFSKIFREISRNQFVLKHRDFPLLSQYGLPPKDLDLTDRWAKKKFIWFTLAYNAHQELECFDSLENYQAAMLIKDAVSMVSINAPEDLPSDAIDASEVLLPVDAIDASEVLSNDAIDASGVLPVDASKVLPIDAIDASEVLSVDASEVLPVDAIDAFEVLLPVDAPEMMPVDVSEMMPVNVSEVMPDDAIDVSEVLSNDASEVIPDDASEVMSGDAYEVLSNDASEVMPGEASEVMSGDAFDVSEDNALQYMFLQKRYKDLQAKLLVLQANKPQDAPDDDQGEDQEYVPDDDQGEDQEYVPDDDQGEDQEYVPDDDQEDSMDEGQQYAPDNDQEMEEDPEKEEMDKKTALLAILNLRLIDMDRAIEPPPFPVAPRFKRCVAFPQQANLTMPLPQQDIVRMYTTKQQVIEESKISLKKSYSEWLPTQRYPRLLQQTTEPVVLTAIDLQTMEVKDLYAFANLTEAATNRSTNAIIRYNVMKGQVIEQLVIRAKKSRSRSRICDIYAEVNTSLKNYAIQRGEIYVEIGDRHQQKLRALSDAAEYLELDKYDYKCTLKELFDRAPQIVKEANSLKPVVEKRPAVRRRAAPAAKKQRVE